MSAPARLGFLPLGGTPRAGRHLNLQGAYDFSDQFLPAEAPFDMDLIAAWQPPGKPA